MEANKDAIAKTIHFLRNLSTQSFNHPEEILKNSESYYSTDHAFLQQVSDKIQECFGDRVKKKLKDNLNEPFDHIENVNSQEKLALITHNVENEIISSPDFQNISLSFGNDALRCFSESHNKLNSLNRDNPEQIIFYHDKTRTSEHDSCSVNSSFLSGSYYSLFEQEQYQYLAEKLHPRNSIDTRINTLKRLCDLASNDLVSHEMWLKMLKKNLRICLGDENEEIFNHALKVHVRLISSGLPFVVQEGFTNLQLFLKIRFAVTYQLRAQKLISSLNPEHNKFFKIFRLLDKSLKTVPLYWIRYPESCALEILNGILKLLIINIPVMKKNKSILCPLNFLAVIDPTALWFRAWLRSSYGKVLFSKVIYYHKKFMHKVILTTTKSMCMISADTQLSSQESHTVNYSFDAYHLQHLRFIHCLCIIKELLLYQKTADIFIELYEEMQMPSSIFFSDLIRLLDLKCSCIETDNQLCPSSIISSTFAVVIKRCLELTRPPELLVQVLEILSKLPCDGEIRLETFHLCELMNAIIEEKSIFPQLESIELHGKSGASVISNFINNVLKAAIISNWTCFEKPKLKYLVLILKISSRYLCHPESVMFIVNSKFHISLVELYKKFQSVCDELPPYFLDNLESSILLVLGNLLSTQVGILALQELDFLATTIDTIFYDKVYSNFEISLTQITSNHHGYFYLLSSKYIHSLCSQIWKEIFLQSDNFFQKVPLNSEISDNLRILHAIYPSIYIDYELADEEDEPKAGILTFLDELRSSTSDEMSEKSSIVYLSTINILVTSLHLSLLLQTRYNIVQELFNAQTNNIVDGSSDVILDRKSWYRNHALVRILVIGGPGERNIPSLNSEEEDNFYDWKLFADYPVPSIYWIRKSKDRQFPETNLQDIRDDPSKLVFLQPSLHNEMLPLLLAECVHSDYSHEKDDLTASTIQKLDEISDNQKLGIEISIRYGLNLELVPTDYESAYQGLQVVFHSINKVKDVNEVMEFDFMISTIFLMMNCDVTATISFFKKFEHIQHAKYIWLPWRSHGIESSHKASVLCHHIELLMSKETSEVYSAFQISNYSPTHIIQLWLRQMFWCHLDMPQIAQLVILVLIFGGDFVLYFILSVFKHLEAQIITHAQRNDLPAFLKTEGIVGYEITEHLHFIMSLHHKYGRTIIEALQASL